jgi:hypothetical protein
MNVQPVARELRHQEASGLGAGKKNRTASESLDDNGSREPTVVELALEVELAAAPDVFSGQLDIREPGLTLVEES